MRMPEIKKEITIREVWQCNLEEEFVEIRKLVNKYCYVAIDTEFPGKTLKNFAIKIPLKILKFFFQELSQNQLVSSTQLKAISISCLIATSICSKSFRSA